MSVFGQPVTGIVVEIWAAAIVWPTGSDLLTVAGGAMDLLQQLVPSAALLSYWQVHTISDPL